MDNFARVTQVFRPSAPIDDASMFVGRRSEVEDLTRALVAPGRHVVVFGQRGVGKTSLLNVVAASLAPDLAVVRYTCSHSDTYADIVRKYLECTGQLAAAELTKVTTERELNATFKIPVAEGGAAAKTSIESQWHNIIPLGLTPDAVATKYLTKPSIFVIDEFDRLADPTTRVLIAETIKIQADRGAATKIVLCGVGKASDTVIGVHPSTIRTVFPLHLEPMPDNEIHDLVAAGFRRLGLRSEDGLLNIIVRASHGLPYFAHLLGEELAILATSGGARFIRVQDFFVVLRKAIRSVPTIITAGFDGMFIPTSEDVVRQPELFGQERPRGGPTVPAGVRRAVIMALALLGDANLDTVAHTALMLMKSANEYIPSDYADLDFADVLLAVEEAEKFSDFIVLIDDTPRFSDAFARGYTWLKAAHRYGAHAIEQIVRD